MVTGMPDRVARRVKAGVISTGSRKQRLTAYFSCNSDVSKPLYIHPESCLYRKDPSAELPEYVIYGALVENEAGNVTYMTSVTAIEASWLPELTKDSPLLKFSEMLPTPTPYYNQARDEITCYVIPIYGVHNWELTPVRMALTEAIERSKCYGTTSDVENGLAAELGTLPGFRKQDEAVRWFARLLLEGKVLDEPTLRGVFTKNNLKLSASTITGLKATKSGTQLLLKLAKCRIYSVSRLAKKLKEDPLFLFEELQGCLHLETRKLFRQQWMRFVKSSTIVTLSGNNA